MDVIIANGASLSSAVDLVNNRLSYISMPSSWTAANLTFQVSEDGLTWNNLYDDVGSEVTVAAAASRVLRVDLAKWLAVRYLKIRSGTSGTPVAQGGDRTLRLGTVSVL
jgi:hypothetical protein